MKRSLILLCSLALTAGLYSCQQEPGSGSKGGLSTDLVRNPASATPANPADLAKLPNLQFDDSTHDFGKMKAGEKGTYEFAFRNTGGSPLLISNAEGSCGCTVPDYPHEPVPPGGGGKITVTFNSAGKQGHQEKSVTVMSNARRGHSLLLIQADVEE